MCRPSVLLLPQEMFNDDAFSKIKKGARIVNVARGGVIDDAALARALDSGAVAQARAWTCCRTQALVELTTLCWRAGLKRCHMSNSPRQ